METNVRVRKSILWLLSGKQTTGLHGQSPVKEARGAGQVFPCSRGVGWCPQGATCWPGVVGVEANHPAPSHYNQVDNNAYYVPRVCAFKPPLPWKVDTIIITLILQVWKLRHRKVK